MAGKKVTLNVESSTTGEFVQTVDGRDVLQISPTSTVTFVATIENTTESPTSIELRRTNEDQPAADPVAGDSSRWELSGGAAEGDFHVVATFSDGEVKSEAVSVSSKSAATPEPDPSPPNSGQAVTETDVGEYDARFAGAVGSMLAFATTAVVIVGVVGIFIFGLGSPAGSADVSAAAPSTPGSSLGAETTDEPSAEAASPDEEMRDAEEVTPTEPAPGNYRDRSVTAIAGLVAIIGGLTVLGGVAMAALETRGRLKAPPEGGEPASKGLFDDLVSAGAKFLDSARLARGTVVVMVAGMILLLAPLAAVTTAQRGGLATDEPAPTVAPSPSPSVEPSQSPETTESTPAGSEATPSPTG